MNTFLSLRPAQRGSTFVGIIIGLVIGLVVALAVAVYVTKAPVNFSHKTQPRTPEQLTQEAKKNKDWDPNVSLQGKNPVKPVSAPTEVPPPGNTPPAAAVAPAPAAPPVAAPQSKSADPIGDLAKAKTQAAAASGDPFIYYVQSGAYRAMQEADAQKAKIAMLGLEAKITEREQSGYTVYRVRVGPIDKKDEADKIKAKLDSSGLEPILVRVNR